MDLAIITTIEDNSIFVRDAESRDEYAHSYVQEAFLCYRSWRKHGGGLKDIPIYALCITENKLSQADIDTLTELNVNYIEIPPVDAATLISPYCHVINCGVWAEKNLKHEYFLHIDLDMSLLPGSDIKRFFNGVTDENTGLGVYPSQSVEPSRLSIHVKSREIIYQYFETCLIASTRESGFYAKWNDELHKYVSQLNKEEYSESEIYEMEEFIIDVMHSREDGIIAISHFEVGLGYVLPENITKEEILQYCFLHQHLGIPNGLTTLVNFQNTKRKLLGE